VVGTELYCCRSSEVVCCQILSHISIDFISRNFTSFLFIMEMGEIVIEYNKNEVFNIKLKLYD